MQHKNLLGKKVVIRATNHLNLQRNIVVVARQVARKMLPVLLGLYRNPSRALDPAVVIDLIPSVDQGEGNNTPVFQVKDGKLHRRSDLSDLQSKKTTTNWWGATTAALLAVYHPKTLPYRQRRKKPLRSVCVKWSINLATSARMCFFFLISVISSEHTAGAKYHWHSNEVFC